MDRALGGHGEHFTPMQLISAVLGLGPGEEFIDRHPLILGSFHVVYSIILDEKANEVEGTLCFPSRDAPSAEARQFASRPQPLTGPVRSLRRPPRTRSSSRRPGR